MPPATDPVGAITAIALLIGTLYALQNCARYIRAKDWNGTIGLVLAWVLGCAVVALGAQSEVTDKLHLIQGAPELGKLGWASLLMLGVSVGSGGSVLADARNAFDNTTSAAKPPIANKPDAGQPE